MISVRPGEISIPICLVFVEPMWEGFGRGLASIPVVRKQDISFTRVAPKVNSIIFELDWCERQGLNL